MSRPTVNLAGQAFGRWTALSLSPIRSTGGKRQWNCVCACGTTGIIPASNLRMGRSLSCGCVRAEKAIRQLREQNVTHDASNSREYRSWAHMRHRCSNPNSHAWRWYGGRGITVCERWQKFENFLADMGPRPPATTLDRIDGSQGYSKENCRWATADIQGANKRPRMSRHV